MDLLSVLENAGYSISVVAASSALVRDVAAKRPDLIIYHCETTRNHMRTLAELRERVNVPLLVVGCTDGDNTVVQVLRAGADDVLTYPYSDAELLARIEAALRRYMEWQPNEAGEKDLPPISLDREGMSAIVGGKTVKLTPTEAQLLTYLAEHAGSVVPREELYDAIWQQTPEEERSPKLSICIHNLRRKIERDPHRPQYLLTKWGTGYYLAGKVRED